MANAVTVGDLIKLQVVTYDTSQVGINTFWYSIVSAGGTPATDQDISDALSTMIGPGIILAINDNAEYRGVRGQLYNPLTGVPKFVDVISTIGAGAGAGGSTAMAKQVSGITSWYTNLPRQAYRGRTYWPFPATVFDTGDGFPTAAYISLLNSICSDLRTFTSVTTGGRTATFTQVLFHRKTIGSTPISSYINRVAWATQRRRGTFGRPQGAPPF